MKSLRGINFDAPVKSQKIHHSAKTGITENLKFGFFLVREFCPNAVTSGAKKSRTFGWAHASA
jgi:hypothetical protein